MSFLTDLTQHFRLKTAGGWADSATYTPRNVVAGSSFAIIFDELEQANDIVSNAPDHGFIRASVQTTDATTNNMTAKYHANRGSRDIVTVNSIDYGLLKVFNDKNGMTLLELEREIPIKQ